VRDDLAALTRGRDVVADLIVNHVSDRSAAFRRAVDGGDAGMFLTYDNGLTRRAPPPTTC
jgi:glycosidase